MGVLSYISSEGWTRSHVERLGCHGLELAQRIAELQGGSISRQQLLVCGLSSTAIARLIAKNWLIRLYPGLYALGRAQVSDRGKLCAGLLLAGPESGLGGGTAAFRWKILKRAPSAIYVSSLNQRRSIRNIVIRRRRELHTVVLGGLPVTSPAQTLLDISLGLPDRELRKALANADFEGLLDPDALFRVMGKGQHGSAKLRRAIERHMPELSQTLSPLEDMLLLLCERHGIPLPIPNGRVGDLMPDALWPQAKLIVEVDGGQAHSSPSQRRQDAERDMNFRRLGYTVLRYTWWQIRRQGAQVASEILANLGSLRPF